MNTLNKHVIVVGGGHAGCEAALASARLGIKTTLITANPKKIAMAPCNPSIGGPAKGIVVREIDALGGAMGYVSDMSTLQLKVLNRSKGPAVQALRAQIDKLAYEKNMQKVLNEQELITIHKGFVNQLLLDDNNKSVIGVVLDNDEKIYSDATVITAGTYMDSYIINGQQKVHSGPDDEKTSSALSNFLKSLNIKMFRLKTGTPPRVLASSVDFSKARIAPGDDVPLAFSMFEPKLHDPHQQLDCHLIYTTPITHQIIRENLHKSAMYSGVIDGVGPRYCPSIEDKLVRFETKERHQLFLEPETKEQDSIYIQGFSTSMPYDVQDKMIASLPGLENAKVLKYGYAIEYEAVNPEQLKQTLEFKDLDNLFSAGQVNGTSGYEEAAGQGIIAGINAALKAKSEQPFILTRKDSYIGLMIDDLITKGTTEPYRLLTSRNEYRLLIRSDNADLRLSLKAANIGLISKQRIEYVENKIAQIDYLKQAFSEIKIEFKTIKQQTDEKYCKLNGSISCYDFLKRPDFTFQDLQKLVDLKEYEDVVLEEVEIQIKYEGYVKKIQSQIKRQEKNDKRRLPIELDYLNIANLSLEAREKLAKIRPETIGQASRISGVNPVDISVLIIHLEKLAKENNE